MVKRLTLLILSTSLLAMVGCGGKKELVKSENMEQIHAREGIPVKIETLQKDNYSQSLSFPGKLKGLKESTVTSSIAGRIESIVKDVNAKVKADDVVITVPTDVPASQFAQVKEAHDLAESTYNRMLNLFASGAISQQDLDQVKVQYEVAKSNLGTINKILNVEAPISGIISIMYSEVGDVITPGQKLFQVVDTSCYRARIYVPESQIRNIKKGQKATAKWSDITLNGKVDKVSSAIDLDTNAFIVDILFSNKHEDVKIGVTADIKIEVYTTNSIAIESQYVVSDNGKDFVFVKNGDKAQRKEVQIARSLNGKVEIASGVNEGDILITQGAHYVSDNSLIKIIK
ncbi:MAG: efflux RND transporter periplasmic adaptor subunit [Candidatus Cloacimonadales bacterium]